MQELFGPNTRLFTGRAGLFSGNGGLFGKGGVDGFPGPFVIVNRPRGTVFYDSLGNNLNREKAVAGSYNDTLTEYFDATSGGIQDMSTDGCSLLKSVEVAAGGTTFIINDDSGADPAGWVRGTNYETVLAALSAPANTSDYALIMSGINDANPSGGNTKEKHKQALAKLKEFLRADFVNMQCGFLHVLHRNDDAGASNDLMQQVREAILETISEDPWYYRLPDMYDVDHFDASHFTQTVDQTIGPDRIIKAVAYVFGKTVTGSVYGANVTSAIFYGGHVDMTVTHDAGTDFDTISSGAENTIGLRIGSTDYKLSSVERINATTLRGHFEGKQLNSSAVGNLMIAHGHMNELALTSATVIKDNAADSRPIRASVLAPTVSHPLFNVSNLDLHFIAKVAAKTYSSGALVSSAVDRCAKTWTAAAGDEPTYDATAFGNMGAVYSTDGDRFFQSPNASWTAGSSLWIGIVFEVPAVTASNKYLMTFEGSTQAALYFNGSGVLFYQTNGAGAVVTLSSDLRSTKNFLMLNYTSTGNVDVYLNSATPTNTFDPHDGFTSFDRLTFFNRTAAETGGHTGMKIAEVFARDSAHSGSDPSIASILAFYQSYYGTQ